MPQHRGRASHAPRNILVKLSPDEAEWLHMLAVSKRTSSTALAHEILRRVRRTVPVDERVGVGASRLSGA